MFAVFQSNIGKDDNVGKVIMPVVLYKAALCEIELFEINKHIHNQMFQTDTFNATLHSELIKPHKLIWRTNDTQ